MGKATFQLKCGILARNNVRAALDNYCFNHPHTTWVEHKGVLESIFAVRFDGPDEARTAFVKTVQKDLMDILK